MFPLSDDYSSYQFIPPYPPSLPSILYETDSEVGGDDEVESDDELLEFNLFGNIAEQREETPETNSTQIKLQELEERAYFLNMLSSLSLSEYSTYAKLESILKEIQEINREAATTTELDSFLVEIVEKISLQSTPQELQTLTSLINTYFSEQSVYWIAAIYRAAEEKIPTLKRYVRSKIISYAYSFPVITAECAYQIVQEKLTKKGFHHVFFPQVFCHDNLLEKLKEFITSEKSIGIFLTNSEPKLNGHFSAFIIERKEDKLQILNSDSLFVENIDIQETLLCLEELSYPYDLFFLAKKRQRDTFSCPAFSIQDLFEALKICKRTQKSFFEYIQENSLIEQTPILGTFVNRIQTPPSSMIKLLQSIRKIEKRGQEMLTSKGEEIPLHDYVKKYSFITKITDSECKAINCTAARKSSLYFEKALRFAIESCDENQTSNE